MIELVDFANPRPSGEALVKADKHGLIRYLSPDTDNNPGKQITTTEVEDYRAAGLGIGFVWETTTSRPTQGFNAGVADARAARRVLLSRSAPSDTPIYFVAQDKATVTGPEVAGYFKGIASVMPLAHIGGYGGYAMIRYLLNHKLITWAWQTYAWSGGLWDPRAQLQQYHNGVTVAGVTVDLTRATVANWGQWAAANEEDDMSAADVSAIIAAIPSAADNADAVLKRDGVIQNMNTPGDFISLGTWSGQVNAAISDVRTQVDSLLNTLAAEIVSAATAAVKAALAGAPGGGVSADDVKAIVNSATVSVQ